LGEAQQPMCASGSLVYDAIYRSFKVLSFVKGMPTVGAKWPLLVVLSKIIQSDKRLPRELSWTPCCTYPHSVSVSYKKSKIDVEWHNCHSWHWAEHFNTLAAKL